MRVLLLGSYRDVEARMDAATGNLLARVGREGTTLSLPRLDRAASARLVQERAGAVTSEVEARVYDRSQGNPLFLGEMLRLWNELGDEAMRGRGSERRARRDPPAAGSRRRGDARAHRSRPRSRAT